MEDGDYEIHRKVPYDYDSEYQDIYYRIAEALIEEQITVHEALIYQTEAKHGLHTSRIGRFLRDFPGRLVLYPFQASTIAYIFFEAKFYDMGVAAVVGLAAGLMEYALSHVGGQAKVLIDVVVGLTVGIISGLWYDYRRFCVPSVFLGVLCKFSCLCALDTILTGCGWGARLVLLWHGIRSRDFGNYSGGARNRRDALHSREREDVRPLARSEPRPHDFRWGGCAEDVARIAIG